MPYRYIRRGRFGRIANVARNATAIYHAARVGYRAGRSLLGSIKRRFRKVPARRRGRRVYKRYSSSFLRSIGMTQNKMATHVSRGTAVVNGASTASLTQIGTIKINNCNLPIQSTLAGSTANWDDQNPTGYQHMKSMYRKYTVVGAKLFIRIKRSTIDNLAYIANVATGSSYYNNVDSLSYKYGVHVSEENLATDGYDNWPQIQMTGTNVKTHVWRKEVNNDYVNLRVRWSLRKHLGTKNGLLSDTSYTAMDGIAPVTPVYAFIWEQIANLVGTPNHGNLEISWTLYQYTRWSDFIGAESDMVQSVPS